ncbi:MAG TPA: LLM class flavin-dependent oxidoreductase [Microbacteriaceae bacterium]|nr:LLM class flavin-dependent oxidoreductase [Microbacteriaceae bacterium]
MFEIGVITFGEVTTDPVTGVLPTARQRVKETIEQAKVADEVGLDVFGIGEHHRSDFVASTPAILLAGAATATKNIRLTSSVSVLSTSDPVRVYEEFATLDLLSGGRAEVIAGRGSYTESFPLFGYSLEEYDELYEEKVGLLLKIRDENPVTWSGRMRAPLEAADVAPRALQEKMPIWRAVGGSPASAVRAGRARMPLMLAFIVGPLAAFQRLAGYYLQAADEAGMPAAETRIGAAVHGFVGATSQDARDTMFPYFSRGMNENNHQRGVGFDLPRAAFEAQATPGGMPVVGSPQEVIDKIMTYHEVYGIDRILLQMGFGGVPQRDHLRAIELLGTEVAPVVRRELGGADTGGDGEAADASSSADATRINA